MKTFTFVLSLLFAGSAFASAPQVKTQAPGFYRVMVGDFEVTALVDGFFPMKPKELLSASDLKKATPLIAESFQGELIPTSVNAFLINTGTKLILVDSGCGAFFGPGLGHVVPNLKAAGYTPDQVDEVVFTHMHTDHLGGIVADGKAVFPHATIRMDQKESDYWLNLENAKAANDAVKGMFQNAVTAVAPYKALNQFKPFAGQTEITTGITAMPSYGHTPGHTAYFVESKGKKILLVGDLFHIEAIQFPDPSINLIFDKDQKTSAALRKKTFEDLAKNGSLIGAAHLPFPAMGHVVKSKNAYRYLPVPYAPLE
jgi:glyoxylase-like metal-dependent hydrolase (beta-lactamase superfamily II)